MTCVFCSWEALASLDVPGITPYQMVLQVGGPYPETRAGWMRMVGEFDGLAARWLDYAFEAHRITPRIHGMGEGGRASCLHPEAKLMTRSLDVMTCFVCRYVHDVEAVVPIPSVFELGDVQDAVGPVAVIG